MLISLLIIIFSINCVNAKHLLINKFKNLPIDQKIDKYSNYFLGTPTKKNPLGEGEMGIFDQDPLYSFKYFDCTTFIETIIALSTSTDFNRFKKKLISIRYLDGIVSYKKRNHFISLDWIPNNSRILNDITSSIGPVKYAKAIIDKKKWYEKKYLINQEFYNLSLKLKKLGKEFSPQTAIIPYISISEIIKNNNIIESIPNGSIINIVRPNWNLTQKIGTYLNISHQGFAIWKKNKLYYRHASSLPKKIITDTILKDYLKIFLDSKSLKGINILQLN